MALSPDEERKLRRNWSLLKQELHVEDFLHRFVELGVFPPNLRNDIMNVIPNTQSMKGEKFLNAILACGGRSYQVLCALLRQATDNRYCRVIEALAIPTNVTIDGINKASEHVASSRPSTALSSTSSGTINSETGERNRRIKPVQSHDCPPNTQHAAPTNAPVATVAPVMAMPKDKTLTHIVTDNGPGEQPAGAGETTTPSTLSSARFQIPESVKKSTPSVSLQSIPQVATTSANSTVNTSPVVSESKSVGSDVSVDMKALEQELVRIAPTIADLFHKIAKQTQSNPTSDEDLQKVKEENERLRKTNKSLIEKLNAFQQKIIQLQLDNKRLKESSDVGQVKKKELQQKTNELKEMERRLSEHKKALEEKEVELNIQLAKLKEIEEENEFQRVKIDKLEELQDEGIYERNVQQEQISCLVEEKEKQRDQIDSLEEQQKMGEQRLYRLEERLKMLEQGPRRQGRGRRLVSPPRNSNSPGNTVWMNGIVDRSHHANMKFTSDMRNYNQGRDLSKRNQTKAGWPLL